MSNAKLASGAAEPRSHAPRTFSGAGGALSRTAGVVVSFVVMAIPIR